MEVYSFKGKNSVVFFDLVLESMLYYFCFIFLVEVVKKFFLDLREENISLVF